MDERQSLVDAAFSDRSLLGDSRYSGAVRSVLDSLSAGTLRVAEKMDSGWVTSAWVHRAVLLYFAVAEMTSIALPPFAWYDKIPLRQDLATAGVRAVPGAIVRHGAHVERGAILMPSLVNIGAWVGEGTMVDTWATVGSCAQVGRNVHLSGGVGLGGVLEPPGATPVIIEDGAFIGSRCIVVEGVRVEEEAVLGANVVLTASTPILDVTGPQVVEIRGRVPARAVVVPGTRPKRFPAGEFQVACALIIGHRRESTDRRTSLNDALRDFGVSA